MGGIELEYEVSGPAGGTAVLLIGGLGSQLTSWDDDACVRLAGRGYRVVRFDNRDSGFSTVIEGEADLLGVLLGTSKPAYVLDDLAGDALGLLDHLDIERAHLVGISMGGMVAELVALDHPQRVRSVTALLAGAPGRPAALPSGELAEVLLTPVGPSLEERVAGMVRLRRALAGPGPGFDDATARLRAREQLLRAHHPGATLRQVAAVLGTPPVDGRFATLRVPLLMVHGELDPLIPLASVERAAAQVEGARLLVLPGIGHDLPAGVVLDVIDEVTRFWDAADAGPPDRD